MNMKWDHIQSTKEVLRHVIHVAQLDWLLGAWRRHRGFKTVHLALANTSDRFRAIYQHGVWVHSEKQPALSGVGSERIATSRVREELPALLARLDCHRFLDIGCGDWNWMQEMRLDCEYLGIDIVPEVIEANRQFERPGLSFSVADAIAGPLPSADVAFCREMLFHLSFGDAIAALSNIRDAAKWLIATTDSRIWFNSDAATGDYRMINLCRPPFQLPRPFAQVIDDHNTAGRVMGVWPTSALSHVGLASVRKRLI